MSSAFNIPAGYWLAPMEPTPAMIDAGLVGIGQPAEVARAIYLEMLAAAPTPPVDAVPGEPVASNEHIDEIRAVLQGAHAIMESVCAMERRVGPVGSHARGYTHKITAALRHLDALAASVASRGSEPVAGDNIELRIMALAHMAAKGDAREQLAMQNRIRAAIAPAAAAEPSERIADAIIRDMGELPDYTSPEDQPDVMMATADELRLIILRHLPTPDRERAASLVASEDTRRLDYLQETGSTVELVPGGHGGLFFRIGGLYRAVHADIRQAIDAARASAGEAQS